MEKFLQIAVTVAFCVVVSYQQEALIKFDEFSQAIKSTGFSNPTQEQYKAFIQGLPKGLITTKQEAAMALAHFLHESAGLNKKIEEACVSTGCPGQYQVPGCDKPGKNYYGRGYIQLSWCYNYKDASHDLYGDDSLINDPDKVARDENVAWDTAFWFWKSRVHSQPGVSDGAFGVSTKAINGGLECDSPAGHPVAKKRFEMYKKIRTAFGLNANDAVERGCYN